MAQLQPEGFRVYDLKTEYSPTPLGLGTPIPRFSWTALHPWRGQYQSAYRIRVARSAASALSNTPDMWDSGVVISTQSSFIDYAGSPLQSRTRYFWTVCIRDASSNWTAWSDPAWFEMGLLSPSEWVADWIGSPQPVRGVAPFFRKEFVLDAPPTRARAYICGLGYYELSLNGRKVGNHELDPAWTDYNVRALYVTHDLSLHLTKGKNVIGIILGEGWHGNDHHSLLHGGTHRAPDWTGFPKVMLQIHLSKDDETEEILCTTDDGTWLTTRGPIVMNSLYDGETYDARKELRGWDTPEFATDSKVWRPAAKVSPPKGTIVAQEIEPIRIIQEIRARSITSPASGVYVYDFGQNMPGWVRLSVQGKEGTTVTMKFAEALGDDGFVTQENLRGAKSTDTYTPKGEGREQWRPRFTYHGFRYVQVEGFPGIPDEESLVAQEVRSSVQQTGFFDCSNALLNRIHSCIVWTERGNFHGLPTDCPQRDERMGWLNDLTVRTEEALYNFDVGWLFSKYEQDITDTQDLTGAIADTAPYVWGSRPGDAVCSSYLLIPWLVYSVYGDKRLIQVQYENLKKWNECLGRSAVDLIVQHGLYGDWASPAIYCKDGKPWSDITPMKLMSTGFYYYNMILLSKMARALGKNEEAESFVQLSRKTADAFNREFFDSETANYALGSQASNAFALYLGIAPEDRVSEVVDRIVEDVKKRGFHVTTGNLCTRYLLDVLSASGNIDTAYQLATQRSYPSWGYMVDNGATTIWERWEAALGAEFNMHSQNHPMYCSIGAWFYRTLAGIIPDESGPGYERFIIKPYLPKDLSYTEASLRTVRGEVRSRWQKRNGSIALHVTIPFNSTARVFVPKIDPNAELYEGKRKIGQGSLPEGIANLRDEEAWVLLEVGSGSYHFQSRKG